MRISDWSSDVCSTDLVIQRPAVNRALQSTDGTRKWLLAFPDGQEVEAVHIPESDRGTLCVSSQVGCTLTCRFCHTGTQRLVRNQIGRAPCRERVWQDV